MDVVFFDIDDTLYDQAQPFAYAVHAVLGDTVDASDAELYAASRRHSGEVFAAFDAGGRPTDAIYVRRMQATLAEFGVSVPEGTARRIQHIYATSSGRAMSLSPTMARVLDLCAAHARVGIISNGRTRQQHEKLSILGIDRWVGSEAVFVSEELGLAKPDPAIFRYACSHLGTFPERCLYVGDSFENDVPGAVAAGMPVVWFHHRDWSGAVVAPGTPQPTWTVTSAEELYLLLTGLLR